MRVIVFGGTRFVGLSLVEQLVAAGHSVAVVHRGRHEPERLSAVEHIHLERSSLREHRQELLRFGPDAAVDMAAMTAADAQAVADVLDASTPLVVASSADVYRACASVFAGTVTDPAPLPEDLLLTGEIPQPWMIDSTKARERLGWVHEPAGDCVERSVRWHLEHPPPPAEVDLDFSADDAALKLAADSDR